MTLGHLSLFENEDEFKAAESEGKLLKPNVSYVRGSNTVSYMPKSDDTPPPIMIMNM